MSRLDRTVVAALAAGALFGAGLVVSGMTDARKVLAFLDVAGAWDPSLLFVLGAAVTTTAVLTPFVLRRERPVLAQEFRVSTATHVDVRLLGGAAMFGVGWGLAGYCPGPVLAGIGVLSPEAIVFVPAMLVGMVLHRPISPRPRAAA